MAFIDPAFIPAHAAPQEEIGANLPRTMALNIKDPTTDRLVRELAATTGESITTAVTVAVRERLERIRGMAPIEVRKEELLRIAERAAALPVLDDRSPDEIIGYDEDGLPT
ncbi:MAG TPA: type II toxin-antitoxin system VapB family antitoxin [Conexibacter sp.]|nr:type II toxin-antitoxin system VapB family antitoxin [Conexibacter sp.]